MLIAIVTKIAGYLYILCCMLCSTFMSYIALFDQQMYMDDLSIALNNSDIWDT